MSATRRGRTVIWSAWAGLLPACAVLLSAACSETTAKPRTSTGAPVGVASEHDASVTPEADAAAFGEHDEQTHEPSVNGQADAQVPSEVCADVQVTPERIVPTVVFLVDGSSSMKCVYPEDASCDCESQIRKTCTVSGSESRWSALAKTLFGDGAEEGLLKTLGSAVRFGVWVYNNAPTDAVCPAFPARVDPALDQYDALAAVFPGLPPGYNTPTGLALAELVAALPDADDAQQQGLGPQNVVLATDGQPFQCVDPDTLAQPALDYAGVVAAAESARDKGIDLYVMSLAPASGEFAQHLGDVASTGRTGAPYTPSDKDALSAALDDIIGRAISCTVALNGAIESPDRCTGTAMLGGQPLTCGDADGFAIVDERHVALKGAACTRYKREPGIELSMTFPCDAFVIQ